MKIKELKILEKRRNPDHPAQQKKFAYNELQKYADRDDIFISFTVIDKIGINPQSKYDTPLGIYTYPLKEIFPKLTDKKASSVPFAGEHPNIWVVKSNGKMLDLDNFSGSDLDKAKDSVVNFMKKVFQTQQKQGYRDVPDKSKQNQIITGLINNAIADARVPAAPGQFWNLSRKLAEWSVDNFGDMNKAAGKAPVQWNMIMRKVFGYDGVIDRDNGIIHPSEPLQAVFFSKSAFEVVEKIRNIDDWKNDPVVDAIKKYPDDIEDYPNPPEELQLIAVSKKSKSIQYIENPTEKVQKVAVQDDVTNIGFIENPSENIQLMAIKEDEFLIQYIKDPTEKVQIAAVKENPRVIRKIANPVEAAQLVAVKADPELVYYFPATRKVKEYAQSLMKDK